MRIRTLAKITYNRERHFGMWIEEGFLKMSIPSLNKKKLSKGQNGGIFKRKKEM